MHDRLQILRPAGPAWSAWLSDVPCDFDHLSGYQALGEANDDGHRGMAAYGRSISNDLNLDAETRRAGYRRVIKRGVRHAASNGGSVEAERIHRNRLLALHAETMGQSAAADRYRLSRVYFDNLVSALESVLHLAVATIDDHIIAALLFNVYRGVTGTNLAGSGRNDRSLSPHEGLIDGIADIAQVREPMGTPPQRWAGRRGRPPPRLKEPVLVAAQRRPRQDLDPRSRRISTSVSPCALPGGRGLLHSLPMPAIRGMIL